MDERAWKLKKMLMKKELIPEAKESNLLHWEARQQIRYMNEQDPLEWTPERIAQEFPISVNGARRLLRSKSRIEEDKIEAFNKEVDARWRLLKKIRRTGEVPETGPVSLHQKTIELYLANKLQCEELKAGDPTLPKPPPELGIKVPYPVGREGKNFAMFQDYMNLLEDKSSDASSEVETNVKPISQGRAVFKADAEIGDDPEAASHLDLPDRLRSQLYREHSSETMTLEDFKKQAKIETMTRIEGKKEEPKKPIKKKKLNHTSKSIPRAEKYKERSRRNSQDLESDGTYATGRKVFSSDGEMLYRKPRW